MKKIVYIVSIVVLLSSCSTISNIFHKKDKNGCPSNGKNVGAEKLVRDDPKAVQEAKKASKFKETKEFKD
ncbi:MAG: hypothetical protein C0459_01120 [Chitinophaga sp.]|jgi:uncharacterized protein YceK|nr:hypothetical protein [Chitinophaga sp.]